MSRYSSKGFSIIELLVVVSIISILTITSFAYYNNFTADKNLETETRKLSDVLNLARKKASSADATCNPFNGYQVKIDSTIKYSLWQLCGIDGVDNAPIKSYDVVSDGVTLTPNTGNVIFNPLSSGATITGISIIKVANTSGKCYKIDLSPTGTINVGDLLSTGCVD